MSEQNAEVVARWFGQVWSKGRLELVEVLMSPNCVGHGLERKDGAEIEGVEEHQRFIAQLRSAFPDLGVSAGDFMVAGEAVSVSLTLRGTHMGEGLGIEPTHTGVLVSGLARFIVREGRIEVAHYALDFLNLWLQLGVVRFEPAFEGRPF